VPRGFLGIELADDNRGVMIRAVLAGSPAAAAGLKTGDRLQRVGSQTVKTSADVARRLARLTAGATVELTVDRDGAEHAFAVKLGEGL
jgi:serine protease Do